MRIAIVGAALLGSTVVGCANDPASPDFGPCAGANASACGTSCASDDSCGAGLHCQAGSCTAECSPAGKPCPDGLSCTGSGTCVPGGGSLFGSDAGFLETDGAKCIDTTVGFEQLVPTVIVLVDRSGSMNDDFGNGKSRWENLRTTLVDPAVGILPRFDSKIRLGLTMYTSFDGSRGGECPILVEVPPRANNVAEITRVYTQTEIAHQEDDTPTSESLRAVTTKLLAVKDVGPKAIVLATDGEPDTCADPDAHDAETNALSVAAVTDAFAAGITTSVISVGDEVGQQHLQDLANAGVGGAGGKPYRALDADSLVQAFDEIIRGVVSCEFQLDGTVQTGRESSGTVLLDGKSLGYQDPDGWDLPSNDRVRLVGRACTEVKTSTKVLHIQFPCDSYVKAR
ncbi:MAG TPA: vWA domain-containing protein [Polyangiaceae bacterium]|nr:vWA domain-containing protein [Polyangiaceae bacterium]